MGIPINVSSTKSENASLSDKFRDVIEKTLNLLDVMKRNGYRYEEEDFVQHRIKMGIEYNAMITTAHQAYPDIYPLTTIDVHALTNYHDEPEYYRSFLVKKNKSTS